jgi:uncharacterized membrane protein YqgA involved in biofilm formation
MRGTYLNTATVAVGAAVGLGAGAYVPLGYKTVALEGIGLVTSLIGVRMFFQTKNAVISVAAIVLGGIIGTMIGIPGLLDAFAEWCRHELGAGGRFNEGLITSAVLFCVGPMTILGCLQDGLEGKIDLLAIKSTLDGISAFFLAATLGAGVLVTAVIVLVVQGAITLAAGRMKNLAADEEVMAEASAVGGAILLGIGLGLLNIKNMRMETYLPAIVLAPAFVVAARRLKVWRAA